MDDLPFLRGARVGRRTIAIGDPLPIFVIIHSEIQKSFLCRTFVSPLGSNAGGNPFLEAATVRMLAVQHYIVIFFFDLKVA